MLDWVIIAIISQMSFAAGSITEKITRNKYFTDSTSSAILILFALSLPVVLLPIANVTSVGLTEAALAIFAGLLTFIPNWLYSESLKKGEITRVAPLWQTIPVFVLILAFVFLGERLPSLFYVSFALILAGGFLISYHGFRAMLKLDGIFLAMLLASFLFAAQAVLLKYLYDASGFLGIIVLLCLGRVLGGLLMLSMKKERGKFIACMKAADKRVILLMLFFDSLAVLLYNYAISAGPVTVVEGLSGFYPLFVLIFAILVSSLLPGMLNEQMEKKVIALKLFAIFLMFAGLALLYI
jgi:drug/metabolite transporter (DMT)-like permease